MIFNEGVSISLRVVCESSGGGSGSGGGGGGGIVINDQEPLVH